MFVCVRGTKKKGLLTSSQKDHYFFVRMSIFLHSISISLRNVAPFITILPEQEDTLLYREHNKDAKDAKDMQDTSARKPESEIL